MHALVRIDGAARANPATPLAAWAARLAVWGNMVPPAALRQFAPVLNDDLSARLLLDARYRAWAAGPGQGVGVYRAQVAVVTRAVTAFAGCSWHVGQSTAAPVEWREAPEAYDVLADAGQWGDAAKVNRTPPPLLIGASFTTVLAAMDGYPRPWALAHWVDEQHCVLQTDPAARAYLAWRADDVAAGAAMLGHPDPLCRQYAAALFARAAGSRAPRSRSPLDVVVPELLALVAPLGAQAAADGVLNLLHDTPTTADTNAAIMNWLLSNPAMQHHFTLQWDMIGGGGEARAATLADGECVTGSAGLRAMGLSALVPPELRRRLWCSGTLRCRPPPPVADVGARALPARMRLRRASYPASAGDDWALDVLNYKRAQLRGAQ